MCEIDYRSDVSLCMRVWKEIIKRKQREKEIENNEKESNDLPWDVAVCFKLSFLKNNSQ